MPGPDFRGLTFRIKTGNPSKNVSFKNKLVGFDDYWVGEIGQIGTQMDGLGHCGVQLADGNDYFYNGFKAQDFAKFSGLEKLGVEKLGVFFTRGILIDVAGYKKVDRIKPGEAITAADLKATLKAQGSHIQRGDCVLIRTGHSKLWMVDNETYATNEPGLDLGAALWLIEQEIAHLGADNWGIEVDPPVENNGERIRVHQELIIKHGICLHPAGRFPSHIGPGGTVFLCRLVLIIPAKKYRARPSPSGRAVQRDFLAVDRHWRSRRHRSRSVVAPAMA